ncbi:hypothetical protein ACFXQA_09865 [Microbacterium sp. P07]|uniref:hypothetical protein n=1 Tax=Microbacterium sp. P07 TaxID=3366952 RepID=UPI0037475D45
MGNWRNWSIWSKLRVTRWKIAIAALLLVVLVALLIWLRDSPVIAIGAAILAAICIIAKEALSAFARADGLADGGKAFEDAAAVASLYAAVFGAPAVATAIVTIVS